MRDLKKRTQRFALDCWHLCATLPKSREYNAFVNQLIRSSSSVGANFRASQRSKSDKDFINKLKIVEEECDESMYWIEMFLEIQNSKKEELLRLHKEGNELLSIVVASINTARKRIDNGRK
ncbi:four helix bundle protein [Maribacter sp. 2210JD10-5]|uniref:four helix bundle protein n=1 Tax=Maribacter sp. 2210JD10-5 TaxID=3386272 RepID=UPI0039BCA3D7